MSVELAQRVAWMLAVNPPASGLIAEFGYVPVLERSDLDATKLIVAPSDVTGEVISRDGDREFVRAVDIAVVRACKPDDMDLIAELIAICEAVAETVARESPLDESAEETGEMPRSVNHNPLYSVNQLQSGKFIGIVRAEYEV